MKDLVSVVITTKNEEKKIQNTLESLKNQTHKDIEVVVLDSESIDRTAEIAAKLGAKVISQDTNIPEGRNLGAKHATSDILVFLDADTILQDNWIENSLNQIRANGYEMVVGVLRPREKSLKGNFTTYLWSNVLPKILHMHPTGATFMVKKDLFERLGGFNENLAVLEDANFSKRAYKESEVLFDTNLKSYTSMRRFEKQGYVKTYLSYAIDFMFYVASRGKKVFTKSYKHVE